MLFIQARLLSIVGYTYQSGYFPGIFNLRSLLDILIISSLFYLIITIIKKTKSISVIIGISILVTIYIASVFLNLPLTRTIFQYFFGFFLIIIAIIFQNEFRRLLSLIGVFGGRKQAKPSDQTLETIIRSVKKLALLKIGALMVFPAEENISSYIKGGYVLDGKLSEPLLLSIFDSSSPGHDGAAIIENGRVNKFGVYLPLGKNIEAVKNFGTRHLAALGLSETSDALIIAVSEEKGTISIFHNKSLNIIENDSQLGEALDRFFKERSPQANIRDFKKWLGDRLITAILSLALASALWLVFFS